MHDIGHSVRLRSQSRVGRQNGPAHAAHPAARGCDKPTDINIEIGANLERLEPFVEALGDAQLVIWEISAVTDRRRARRVLGARLRSSSRVAIRRVAEDLCSPPPHRASSWPRPGFSPFQDDRAAPVSGPLFSINIGADTYGGMCTDAVPNC